MYSGFRPFAVRFRTGKWKWFAVVGFGAARRGGAFADMGLIMGEIEI
jgi:hypothetical protein